MKIYFGKNDDIGIYKTVSYDSIPQEIYDEDLWFHIAIVNDHNIQAIVSMYQNKDNKKKYHNAGDIVVSNKLYNDFPITQSVWTADGIIDRVYSDIEHRNKNIVIHSVILNEMVIRKIGMEIKVIINTDVFPLNAGDQIINKIYNLGLDTTKKQIDNNAILEHRNYLYPFMFADKRLVYVENDSKQN